MTRHLPLRAGLTLALVAACTTMARAQVPTQLPLVEWTAQVPDALNEYGRAVAMHDGWAAIGFGDNGVAGDARGAVELYQWSGGAWVFRQKVKADDTHARDFGVAVDLRDGILAVGDINDTEAAGTGAVYLYKLSGSTWEFKHKLLNPDPFAPFSSSFGASVATFGNVLVVGHSLGEGVVGSGVRTGAAYVYRRNPSDVWNFEAKLTGPGLGQVAEFGRDVALHNTLILIGAPGAPGAGSPVQPGRVYVVRRSGGAWVPDGFIEPPAPVNGDGFGRSVALDGTRAVVGAYGDDDAASAAGAVHVFEDDGSDLDFVATLTAPGAAANDWLGWDVALDGDLLVASAVQAQSGGFPAGAAFAWRYVAGTFVPERWLRSNDPASQEQMALVAVRGDHVLATVPSHDHGAPGGLSHGAVYAFILNWDDLGFGLPGTGTPKLAGAGTLLPASPIAITSSGAFPSGVGFLFVGFARVDLPFKGGVLVPAFQPPLGLMFPIGTGHVMLSSAWPAGIPAGIEVYFQLWAADPGAPAGAAASNALRAVVP